MKQFMALMVFGVVFSASAVAQNESFSAVFERYDTWRDHCFSGSGASEAELPTNVIYLKSTTGGTFCNQVLGNPKVLKVPFCPDIYSSPSDDWMVFGYGDVKLDQGDIGDAIYGVRRVFRVSEYAVDPSCTAADFGICDFSQDTLPRLAFPPAVSPSNWDAIGGLSTGVAVFPLGFTIPGSGYKYGMFVNVSDRGCDNLPHPGSTDDRFFIAWAVSADGVTWSFEREGGGMTDNPREALPIIFKQGFFLQQPPVNNFNGPFLHQAGFLSDSVANGGDGLIYFLTGYWDPSGFITTISFRMTPNPGHPTGRGALQIFRNGAYIAAPALQCYTTPCMNSLCATDATRSTIPYPFAMGEYQFLPGAVDPQDIMILRKANGTTFDSLRFVYNPLSNFSCAGGRVAIRKSLAKKHPFNWGPERDIDVTPFHSPPYPAPACPIGPSTPPLSVPYSVCGAGNLGTWYAGLVQPPNVSPFNTPGDYYDGSGNPTSFIGYFGAARTDETMGPCSYPCSDRPQGLLATKVSIRTAPCGADVKNFRVAKTATPTILQANWDSLPNAAEFRIAEGNLATITAPGLPNWDHLRKVGGIAGNATSATLPTCAACANTYFLIVPTSSAGSELSYGAPAAGLYPTVADGGCPLANTPTQRCPVLPSACP